MMLVSLSFFHIPFSISLSFLENKVLVASSNHSSLTLSLPSLPFPSFLPIFLRPSPKTSSAPLSTHAARLALLSQQIKALEDENVGVKPWALAGEAGSKSRPINAILEEDLEFENVGKQVPVVTEEKVKGLEDKIKQRILDVSHESFELGWGRVSVLDDNRDFTPSFLLPRPTETDFLSLLLRSLLFSLAFLKNDFNDVLRRRALDAKPFLPSRVFELQDQQSTKSLAQIYEDEYTASSSKVSGGAGPPIDDRDGKLRKEHEEIEKTWGEICYKLDSLSNANFTPKQVRTTFSSSSVSRGESGSTS